jgi:hypothetical protein
VTRPGPRIPNTCHLAHTHIVSHRRTLDVDGEYGHRHAHIHTPTHSHSGSKPQQSCPASTSRVPCLTASDPFVSCRIVSWDRHPPGTAGGNVENQSTAACPCAWLHYCVLAAYCLTARPLQEVPRCMPGPTLSFDEASRRLKQACQEEDSPSPFQCESWQCRLVRDGGWDWIPGKRRQH